MAGPRKDVIREDIVGVYHVWSRCVRQMGLCGFDEQTGRNNDHRKTWIYERVQELVKIFAIDACVFAILSNHFHLLLRNRVDLSAQWSDEEVVRRWWQLCPERRDELGQPASPTHLEIRSLLADSEWVAERRKRLSSISWFMKFLNEPIAKRANAEDGVLGHFFQDRFGCRNLLDEGAILACSIYIDLNEMRAELAETPETSTHTSAYLRILARIKRQHREAEQAATSTAAGQADDPDYWLCPMNENECAPLLGPENVESVVASEAALREMANPTAQDAPLPNTATVNKKWRHGFLTMDLDEYLEFLDWNARQVVPGKGHALNSDTPPILKRLGMAPEFWIKMIENFDLWFHAAAGSAEKLAEHAVVTGRLWLQGIGPMRGAFG